MRNILRKKMIENGAMTGTSQLATPAVDCGHMTFLSFHAVWTGTPTGVFKVQKSNDGLTWTDDTEINSQITNPSGAAGDLMIEIADLCASYCRLIYTNASSTGVLNVNVQAKGNS